MNWAPKFDNSRKNAQRHCPTITHTMYETKAKKLLTKSTKTDDDSVYIDFNSTNNLFSYISHLCTHLMLYDQHERKHIQLRQGIYGFRCIK